MNRISAYYDVAPRGDIDEPTTLRRAESLYRRSVELRWAAECDRRIAEMRVANARRIERGAAVVFIAAALVFVAALIVGGN